MHHAEIAVADTDLSNVLIMIRSTWQFAASARWNAWTARPGHLPRMHAFIAALYECTVAVDSASS